MEKNYKELGLKVGLEIHRQLDTKKLFSPVPTQERDNDIKVTRKLRPTMSEMGEIDQAALEEVKKGRKFVYHGNKTKHDLVYFDEEPPHDPDEEAIDTGLQISFLLNSVPVDQIHFMRKVVIDGSTISGFQRTAVIGTNGEIETSFGTVRIPSICLEEDAAKIIDRSGKRADYDVGRLGVPLVEITTDPDIRNPKEAKEAASKIGQALKATKNVKRGLGSIRQDLNISIKDGARIEVKGVQDLDLIEELVEKEVERQVNLLEIKETLQNRETSISEQYKDITEIFHDTESEIIRNQVESNGRILAVKLEGFEGLLGREIQPNRRLGTEMADRASKFVSGIFHSDELPSYGIQEDEVEAVKEELGISEKDKDAFVIVANDEEKAKKALNEVTKRAKEAIEKVPEETRKAMENGNTEYMRPLPGEARMYPETDIPPIKIKEKRRTRIQENLPKTPAKKIKELKEEYDLEKGLARQIINEDHKNTFEKIVDLEHDPAFVASFLTGKMKSLKREGFETDKIKPQTIIKSFKMLSDGKISKEALEELIKGLAEDPESDPYEIAEKRELKSLSEEEVKKVIQEIIHENEETIKDQGMRSMGMIMGKSMDELRGKADGELVNKVVKQEIQKLLN